MKEATHLLNGTKFQGEVVVVDGRSTDYCHAGNLSLNIVSGLGSKNLWVKVKHVFFISS